MKKVVQLKKNEYLRVGDFDYFRTPNGSLAFIKSTNIVMQTSEEDEVNIIILEEGDIKGVVFKVNDKYYTHDLKVCLNEDFDIDDFGKIYVYNKRNKKYIFIEYITKSGKGVIDISEGIIISHLKGYYEISFENGIFYANLKYDDGNCNYHILDIKGSILSESENRLKKVDGYGIYYSENHIFMDLKKNSNDIYIATDNETVYGNDWFEVPENVLSVEVIMLNGKAKIIKVLGKDKDYYFNCKGEYYATLKTSKVKVLRQTVLVIKEYEGELCTKLTLLDEKDYYAAIQSKKGIFYLGEGDYYTYFYKTGEGNIFVTYLGKCIFNKIAENVPECELELYYNHNHSESGIPPYVIIGKKEDVPCFYLGIDYIEKSSSDDSKEYTVVKVVCQGEINEVSKVDEENSFKCRAGKYIFVIEENEYGEQFIPFFTTGVSCEKTALVRDDGEEEVYLVRLENGKIKIFN